MASELRAAGITVHVVGLGTKAADLGKMACLPQQTGGRHFNALNPEQTSAYVEEALRSASEPRCNRSIGTCRRTAAHRGTRADPGDGPGSTASARAGGPQHRAADRAAELDRRCGGAARCGPVRRARAQSGRAGRARPLHRGGARGHSGCKADGGGSRQPTDRRHRGAQCRQRAGASVGGEGRNRHLRCRRHRQRQQRRACCMHPRPARSTTLLPAGRYVARVEIGLVRAEQARDRQRRAAGGGGHPAQRRTPAAHHHGARAGRHAGDGDPERGRGRSRCAAGPARIGALGRAAGKLRGAARVVLRCRQAGDRGSARAPGDRPRRRAAAGAQHGGRKACARHQDRPRRVAGQPSSSPTRSCASTAPRRRR